MTTARTIITSALEELGVAGTGKTLSAEDLDIGLRRLNALIDGWRLEPGWAYTTTAVTAALPDATRSRTIGSGAQFNTARPVRIESGSFVTTSQGYDYPLAVITDESEYSGLTLKDTGGGWPRFVFYDTGSPTGNVYFWPLGACDVTLSVLTHVGSFATVNTDLTLTPGYERAMALTLAEELGPAFERTPSALTVRNAAAARRALKRANHSTPQLDVGGEPYLGIPPVY